MNVFYITDPVLSIYQRMVKAGHKAKIYYYDQGSPTMEIVSLLTNQPKLFGTYDQFVADCNAEQLPEYSFIEPNYYDHTGDGGGELLASDQHPDHNVQEGERFIAMVYDAIRGNASLWGSTALLIVYDEHGGLYDHVVPPPCTPDGIPGHPYVAQPAATETGVPFAFDRLGIRVPAILVSPYIARGTVVPGTEDPAKQRIFEHGSIPATVTKQFLGGIDIGTDREKSAETFLDLLGDNLRPDNDCVFFKM